MPIRKASAQWEGTLHRGKGWMKLPGGRFEGPYSFGSRFEGAPGTNPEELIAAAHAGCYSMALAHALSLAGHAPRSVHTTAKVHLDKVREGYRITTIELTTEVTAEGVGAVAFERIAKEAKDTCPVSQALAAIEITLQATLIA